MSPGVADRVVRVWACAYTLGVHPTARAERRAELESDLWEHRHAGGGGAVVLSRLVRGMPADLAWRRSARRRGGRRWAGQVLLHTAGAVSFGGLVAQHGVLATRFAGLHHYGSDWEHADLVAAMRLGTAVLALLVVGALLLWRCPRTGVGCLLVAAVATGIAWWWTLPLLVPMTLALGASSASVARRRRRSLG